MKKRIALVGNPNCGKTTLFNELTGSDQYVGNWPGVTVEQKSGLLLHHKDEVEVIDLPGIYSLNTYSLEENVTRDFIEDERPEVIINIVDASNLERNLFLTLQLAEMHTPMVIALNMMDILEARGDKLDVKLLSKLLNIPIVPIVARKSEGTDELIEQAISAIGKPVKMPQIYSDRIESLIKELETKMNQKNCRRMHAVRFIDDENSFKNHGVSDERIAELSAFVDKRIEGIPMDRDMIITDEKYAFITKIAEKVLTRAERKMTTSDKIDRIVTNRFLAIPVFLLIMLLVFFTAFGPLGNLLSDGFSYLTNDLLFGGIKTLLKSINTADWLYSLICDGILSGVGSVLSFLPQLAVLFLTLSLLEDSGYMARAAFITDRLLKRFGLSGRSFIPMLMGFGCTVPALMSARTLPNERDRRLTMLITPFMSCSARLPIYALFAGIFFPDYQAAAIFSMYIIGIIVALLSGIILKKFVTKGDKTEFIMELPEYRMPTFRNLMQHTWEKIRGFVQKAGTVLLIAFIVIWFLQKFNFSFQMVQNSDDSIFCSIGKCIAPLFAPLGFGDWHASSALLTGVIAKEAVVGTFGIFYGGGEAVASNPGLIAAQMQAIFTPAAALSFMTFALLYTPCVAALATMRKELHSAKWMTFFVIYQLVVAWVVAFGVYHIAGIFI